jgi:hypothetical protein
VIIHTADLVGRLSCLPVFCFSPNPSVPLVLSSLQIIPIPTPIYTHINMGSFDDTIEEESDFAIDFSAFDKPEDEFPTILPSEEVDVVLVSGVEMEMEMESKMEMDVEDQGISPSAV